MMVITDVRKIEWIHEKTKKKYPHRTELIAQQYHVIQECHKGIQSDSEPGDIQYDYMISKQEAELFEMNLEIDEDVLF
ncbi:hypothetical protein IMZ31_22325 (plasmid) [Pontibacillus sp. ALD_SL1]|uniref:hypothetical protein n=1 Tax=Pontibacillus sp. ALD_SL1 TaxID=2777185 RepID=UPI001A958377|nr:hypothetical protein [Pontibacillus sp. ALD_SL1]QST02192.1 hypothetical protein IMZ31_22325 [Pontibacillus sp. ALD_SL1]